MNEYDLYRAIGDTDEKFLRECEQTSVRRRPRHFAVIAAVVALMLTACAAPAVIRTYDALKNGTITQADKMYPPYNVYDVEVEIAIFPDAPTSIEEIYLPTGMLEYLDGSSYTLSDWAFSLRCYAGGGQETELFFLQNAFSEEERYENSLLVAKYFFHEVAVPEIVQKTYGDIRAWEYLFDLYTSGGYYSFRNVLWSDGIYFYFFQFPVDWTEEQITDMLSSLSLLEGGVDALPEEVADATWTD